MENRRVTNRKVLIPVILLLVLLCALLCLYIFKINRNTDDPIDVIDIEPTYNYALSGRVVDSNENGIGNLTVELHSDPQTTVTDENGYFCFLVAESGEHTITILDKDGNVLCTKKITVKFKEGSDPSIRHEDGSYYIDAEIDVSLLELELTVEDGDLIIDMEKSGFITSDGRYISNNRELVIENDDEFIITKGKNVMLADGTVIVANGLNVLNTNGGSSKLIVIKEDCIELPGGYRVYENETITGPDGKEIETDDAQIIVVEKESSKEKTDTTVEEKTEYKEEPEYKPEPEDADKGVVEMEHYKGSDYTSWTQNCELEIFKSGEKIAPGTSGTFSFRLNNTRESDVSVCLEISGDKSKYIPLVFSLKDDKTGVKTDDVLITKSGSISLETLISSKDTNTYTLNWSWPYENGKDSEDSKAGATDGDYKLSVTIRVNDE